MRDDRFGPGDRIGGYALEQLLGEGATGIVFAARAADGSAVAVKLLRPELSHDGPIHARFLREARIAAAIESRHLVRMLDHGVVDGTAYLVLPYYPRGSLAARLREVGRLAVDATIDLAAQLGRGLDALHERRILHRDVKPSNVLLDGDGVAALADFGLARAPDSTRLTHEDELLGTAHYLAPELIEGSEASRASDVYALGCLLYECVVGAPPFAARRSAEIAFAHLVEPPPDPRTLRPEVSANVAEALVTALAKEPGARPTTATALARMLHLAHSARRA